MHAPRNNAVLKHLVLPLIGQSLGKETCLHRYWRYSLETFEIAFMILFTVEILVHTVSQGLSRYWSLHWNKLDVVVVGGSWWLTTLGIPAGVQALRSLRILKLILKQLPLSINLCTPPLLGTFIHSRESFGGAGTIKASPRASFRRLSCLSPLRSM